MRVSLGIPLDSRDGTLDRDELLKNFQQNPDGVYKRPGTQDTIYFTTAGTAYGTFKWGTKVYIWNSSNTATTPTGITIA